MPEGAVHTAGRPHLYQRLQSVLRDRIESGAYRPGEEPQADANFTRHYKEIMNLTP